MKKTIGCIITICITLLVCGCDVSRSYERVLNQIQLPNLSGGVSDESVDKPGADEPKPEQEVQQNPETPATSEPQKPDSSMEAVLYPIGVPELKFLTKIAENRESENVFRAQYLVTKEQLDSWEKELADVGFVASNNYLSDGIWNIGVTKLAQSGTSKADFRVMLLIEKSSAEGAEKS